MRRTSFLGLALAIGCALTGCATARVDMKPTPSLLAMPTPSRTVLAPAVSPTVAILPTLGPSPTPISYTIRAGDSLSLIALRYGVTLDALQAVNPGVNSNMLSIGQKIVIPPPKVEGTETPPATSTPVPVPLGAPLCFRAPTNSLRCLVTARLAQGPILEGVTVLVTLVDAGSRPVTTRTAYAPLNLLRPGQAMVLDALFDAPAPEFTSVVATLAGAVPLSPSDTRYEEAVISDLSSSAAPDQRSWRATGTLALGTKAAAPADRVALVILALDTSGEVVGYAKWESPVPIQPGEQTTFDLTVFSLGPPIESVEVQAEAQAAVQTTPG